jgi:hypothetical protein
MPVSSISVSPFGPCQAGCPSSIPAPSAQMSGSAAADGMWLEQNGYQPVWTDPVWDDMGTLSVIIARKFGSTQAGLRAFFFVWGTDIGTDVPEGDGSTSVQAFRIGQDEIDLRYRLHGAAASSADVRFQLLYGNELIRLDPMPPAQSRNS